MTTYMIRTPTVRHVIKAYEYMKRRGIRISDDSNLGYWVKNNIIPKLIKIKAVFFIDDVYDGYSTSFGTMVGYDVVINLEETVTL